MTKMPFNIYAALSKQGSHYWATQLHEELNKTNVFGNPQEQYTHTQQLIEKLEGKKKRKSTAYCIAIDDVIKILRGNE